MAEETSDPGAARLTVDGVVFGFADEALEEVAVEGVADDRVEEEKEEVAPRGSHPGIVVGEEAVEVDDHAGDEAEAPRLQHHRRS